MKETIINITSGTYRGRKLLVPSTAHPMGSREKLALFNMLGSKVVDAKVLDAFAGSGALGLEALSRGAVSVTFLEKDPRAAKVIQQNIATLNVADKTEVIRSAAANHQTGNYDVIFIDPPYNQFKEEEFLSLAELLAPDGILVLSHPASHIPTFDNLKLQTTRHYARANISLFSKS